MAEIQISGRDTNMEIVRLMQSQLPIKSACSFIKSADQTCSNTCFCLKAEASWNRVAGQENT